MIYFTTGGNGTGKTAFTLKDVREQQVKENRPVYYHGFEAGEQLKAWGWLPFEPEKWQELPDGSICIFDECQNEMPVKRSGPVPDWINAIAQFRRKRGFDFWLISPHPSFIDVNVRRLIAAPGWHRHLKRNFGGSIVSHIKYDAPNLTCEKPNAGAAGQVTMRALPKDVFGWYTSASLHTAKFKLPKQFYIIGAAAVLVPALAWYVANALVFNKTKPLEDEKAKVHLTAAVATGAPPQAQQVDFVDSYKPRIPGLPHTAPRYDEVTKPVVAPFPAACVSMGPRCACFSQQGTGLDVPRELCLSIVARGFFNDMQPAPSAEKLAMGGNPAASPAPSASPLLAEPPPPAPTAKDGEMLAQMRVRAPGASRSHLVPAPSTY